MTSLLQIDNFCCIELWKGCILAGIFTMTTSIFDLLWSTAHMIEEENVIFFYLLFSLGIESIWLLATTGLLFVALVRKSKCLLLPWLFMVIVDVLFSLVIAFAELALPNNLATVSCTIPIASTLVTILVCSLMCYCWLCVYAQYLTYSKINAITEIKVTPVGEDETRRQSVHPHNDDDNTLRVPQMSTPKDAW